MVTHLKQSIAIRAPNKQALVLGLKPIMRLPKEVVPPDLHIALPCCGRVREWDHIEDVPDHDVGPCDCGNWFIRYAANEEA